jgi:hypothetical protein
MALENRDVRPFADLNDFQIWLQEHCRLVVRPRDGVGESVTIQPDGTVRLDPKSMLGSNLSLTIGDQVPLGPPLQSARMLSRALGQKDNSVFTAVILGSSPYLRFTEELRRMPLEDLESLRGGLNLTPGDSPRPRSLSLPHNGSLIELAILLSRQLEPKPGLPHRKGTWLARIKFRLASPTEGLGFSPIPLTAELRDQLKLDKQTATFARVNPGQPDIRDAMNLDDFVEYYVDEQLLNRMSANPRHPQSALAQTELFLGAVDFLVMSLRGTDWLNDLKFSEVDGGLVGKLTRIIANESPGELERAFALLKDDPSLFSARVQDQCEYRRRLDENLALMEGRA